MTFYKHMPLCYLHVENQWLLMTTSVTNFVTKQTIGSKSEFIQINHHHHQFSLPTLINHPDII